MIWAGIDFLTVVLASLLALRFRSTVTLGLYEE